MRATGFFGIAGVVFFCAAVFGLNAAAQTVNLARLTRADSLIYEKRGNEEVLRFLGNVHFRKGAKSLRCEESLYFRTEGRAIFRGNVVLNDSGRVLRTDELEYFQNPEQERARGHVDFRARGKELTSEWLRYFDPEKKALATGRVVFRDSVNSVNLFADSVLYWVDKDSGVALGNPKLVKYDSTGVVEITIRSEKLAYNGKTAQALALKNVKITRGDVVAVAVEARFFSTKNKVVITGKPLVEQGKDKMRADTIAIFLKGRQLDRVHLKGRGKMTSAVYFKGKELVDWISGKDIWLAFQKDTLRQVTVREQAISLYHVIEKDREKGINQVLGDFLKIDFKKGKPEYVRIVSTPGLSRGKFYPPGARVKPLKP